MHEYEAQRCLPLHPASLHCAQALRVPSSCPAGPGAGMSGVGQAHGTMVPLHYSPFARRVLMHDIHRLCLVTEAVEDALQR